MGTISVAATRRDVRYVVVASAVLLNLKGTETLQPWTGQRVPYRAVGGLTLVGMPQRETPKADDGDGVDLGMPAPRLQALLVIRAEIAHKWSEAEFARSSGVSSRVLRHA